MISPLTDRTYRHLFVAQVIALAGTGLTTVALALLAYDLAEGNAGAVLGTALALKMIAYVGIAPVVGGFAHKIPRKRILISLDIARAGLVLCFPFVNEIWQIYLLIFLLNACSAGFTPVFQAAIPDILPDEEQYTKALSLSRLAYDLENLLSPTLAALMLVMLSYDALFSANALTFLVSAFLVMSVTLPSPRPREREKGIWNNLTFGLRVYLKTPRLKGLLALSLATAAAGAMIIVNTVVYVRDYLDGTEADTAIALAATGVGSMTVALVLPLLLKRYPDRLFMIFGGLFSGTGLLIGLTKPEWIGLLVIWFVIGAGTSLIQTPAGRVLKRSSNEGDRPAVFAAQFALSHACWLLTYLAAGWIGATFGLGIAFAVLALVALLSTTFALFLWPNRDPEDVEHVHDPVSHEHLHIHDEHHQHEHEGWEGQEPHAHPHQHSSFKHKHPFVIDLHHPVWPEP